MKEIVRDFKTLLEDKTSGSRCLTPAANLIQVVLGPATGGKTTAVQQIADTWAGPVVFASADLPFAPNHEWISGNGRKLALR